MKHRTSDELKILRREFRKHPTKAERLLWTELRGGALGNFRFRRQHPLIGRFIADFYCPEKKLAVEIDGKVHSHQKEIDLEREKYISTLGIRFIRFTNEEVEKNREWVLCRILEELQV